MKKPDPPSTEAFVDDGRPVDQLTGPELADAYFDRKSRVDAFKSTADRCEALAKEVRGRYMDQAADQEFELRGVTALVQIGKKQNERYVTSLFRLYKLSRLKIEDFLAKCKITVNEAETIEGAAKLIDQARTGWRPLKAIKRMPPAE